MGNDNLQILQLVKRLLQQETNDQGLLDDLSQSLSSYGQNHVSSHNQINQDTQILQEKIKFLEEQLSSTVKMAEMTINSMAEELKNGVSEAHYPAINNEPSGFLPTNNAGNGYLGDAMFANEYEMKRLIPQSFFVQTSQDNIKGSFVWAHEVTGIIYLVYVYCEGHSEKRLNDAILCNHFTDKVFLENRLLDACSLIKKVDERVAQVQSQYGNTEHKIQYAVCVIDRMNSKLDYVGANTVLFASQQQELQEIPGLKSSLGKINLNNERCEMLSLDIQRGSQFFVMPHADAMKQQIVQKIRDMGRVDFVTQKQNLTQWLSNQLVSNNIQEFFISGFGF